MSVNLHLTVGVVNAGKRMGTLCSYRVQMLQSRKKARGNSWNLEVFKTNKKKTNAVAFISISTNVLFSAFTKLKSLWNILFFHHFTFSFPDGKCYWHNDSCVHSLCNPTHGTKSCCSVLINKVKTANCNKPNKGKTDKSQITDYVLEKKKQNILGNNRPMFMIRHLGTVKPMIRGKQR